MARLLNFLFLFFSYRGIGYRAIINNLITVYFLYATERFSSYPTISVIKILINPFYPGNYF